MCGWTDGLQTCEIPYATSDLYRYRPSRHVEMSHKRSRAAGVTATSGKSDMLMSQN